MLGLWHLQGARLPVQRAGPKPAVFSRQLYRSVQNPQVRRHQKEIVVTIGADETIYIGKEKSSLKDFPSMLKGEMAKLGRREIFLQVDRGVRYSLVVDIIDLARLAGIKTVSLITEKKSLTQ